MSEIWDRVDEAIDTDPLKLRDIVSEVLARAKQAEQQRDEALEALAYGADTLRRAEQALAALERVRAFFEDMRTWCSPHGIAADYAKRGLEVLDQPKEAP